MTNQATTTKKYISGFFIEEPATNILVPNSVAQNNILNACKQLQTTDIYMYLITKDIVNNTANLQNFISQLSLMGINLWALNGDRSMFLDPNCYGYSELVDEIQAIANYNNNSAPNHKIYGLMTDLEPQDVVYGTGSDAISYVGFHNGLATSQLSTIAGSGIYQNTQLLDRNVLMEQWVQMSAVLKTYAAKAGIKIGMAMVNWTENYYGQAIQCYFGGVTQNVFYHLCNILDEIVIMAYKSSLTNLIACVELQLKYACGLTNPPLISIAYDVVSGDGVTVSLADNQQYDSQTYAISFASSITSNLSTYSSYSGNSIYSIEGFMAMPN